MAAPAATLASPTRILVVLLRTRWRQRRARRAERDPIELIQGRRGTHLMPIADLPPGFVPPSAALAPPPDGHA